MQESLLLRSAVVAGVDLFLVESIGEAVTIFITCPSAESVRSLVAVSWRAKCGVMITELLSEERWQPALWDDLERERRAGVEDDEQAERDARA